MNFRIRVLISTGESIPSDSPHGLGTDTPTAAQWIRNHSFSSVAGKQALRWFPTIREHQRWHERAPNVPRTALTSNASLGEVRHSPLSSSKELALRRLGLGVECCMLKPGAGDLNKWVAGGLFAQRLLRLSTISKQL